MTTTNNYTEVQITVKGNIFSVLTVTGSINYIMIAKLTNNPFRTAGKQFANFDKAQEHYKCAEMKTELLKIELGLN